MVPQFAKELQKLYGKSKKDLDEYKIYLIKNFQIAEWSDQHLDEDPFELLHDSRVELYSLKSQSKRKNVRVLYFYRVNDTIILLCAFEEKSKSDYQNEIKVAIDRIKEIERNFPL